MPSAAAAFAAPAPEPEDLHCCTRHRQVINLHLKRGINHRGLELDGLVTQVFCFFVCFFGLQKQPNEGLSLGAPLILGCFGQDAGALKEVLPACIHEDQGWYLYRS